MNWFTRLLKPNKPKAVKAPPKERKSEKDLATERGEPWVTVLSMNIDLDDVNAGNFELDWNEIFVARLVKTGYKGKTDIEIVNQWFSDLCRNIALESFEQELADPDKRADWNARINTLGY